MQRVIPHAKISQLRAAYGSQFKYGIVFCIVDFLKKEFLAVKIRRLPLDQLLKEVFGGDFALPDDMLEWLEYEGLRKHPRIYHNEETKRFGYAPPLKGCHLKDDLLRILERMHKNRKGGLLTKLVDDSMSDATLNIGRLVTEGKVIQVRRPDRNHVLFYKETDHKLDKIQVDKPFVQLWRRVDCHNKEMSHIKMYLEKQKLPIFDDSKDDEGPHDKLPPPSSESSEEDIAIPAKEAEKKKRKRKKIAIGPAAKRRRTTYTKKAAKTKLAVQMEQVKLRPAQKVNIPEEEESMEGGIVSRLRPRRRTIFSKQIKHNAHVFEDLRDLV